MTLHTACRSVRGEKALRTYKVSVEDGSVKIDIPREDA
jgi:hypothetical protein